MVDITCKGTFAYPVMLHKLADELALLRSELSKNYYKENTDKYRGDREHEISKRGILAELIARHYLDERNNKYEAAPLVWTKPIAKPDIKIGITTFDIKGMKDKNVFMINYDAHNNLEKQPHWYWFIYANHDYTATHYISHSNQVSAWNVKKVYSKIYYKET